MKVKFLMDHENAKAGDIAEVDEVLGCGLIATKKAEKFEAKVTAEIDTKAMAIAVAGAIKEQMIEMRKDSVKVTQPVVKKSWAEVLQEVKKGAKFDEVMKSINITTNVQGENLVSIAQLNGDIDILSSSGLAQQFRRFVYTGTQNTLEFNSLTSIGTAPQVKAEDADLSGILSQPNFAQISLAMKKLVYLYTETSEAIDDINIASQLVNSAVADAFSAYIESYAIAGATYNTHGIESWVGHAQTVSVAKDSGQTAGTISARNITNMYNAQKQPGKAVWVMSRSALGYVQALTTGAGGVPLYMPQNNLSTSPFGTLLGRPIYVSDVGTGGTGAQAVGSVGDISFINPSAYLLVQRNGLTVASSDDVYFLTDKRCWKFRYRIGGRVLGTKWTCADGSYVSDFVTLAVRE